MSLIRKHGAVLQAWACLDLVIIFGSIVIVSDFQSYVIVYHSSNLHAPREACTWANPKPWWDTIINL